MQRPPRTIVDIDTLAVHRDERGCVFEPVPATELGRYRNMHMVMNEPSAVRGNHFHRENQELLVVQGPALVRLRDAQQLRDLHVGVDEVLRCRIPPAVSHAVQNTGQTARLIIVFYTVPFGERDEDVVPDLLIHEDEPTGARSARETRSSQ